MDAAPVKQRQGNVAGGRHADKNQRPAYPTDLTDAQWAVIQPHIPVNRGPGRPTTVDLREVVNALLYMNRTGCQWRMLPHDFPGWSTVRYYFDKWLYDGTLKRMNDQLREKIRTDIGRDAEPSLVILDSQSVKTTEAGGEHGYDGGKKIQGRRRQALVDIMGNLIRVKVHAADETEREGGIALFRLVTGMFQRVVKVFVDAGYQGDAFAQWVAKELGWIVEVAKRTDATPGFVVISKRWVVERTLAWFSRNRRLSKDYERRVACSEAWIYLAAIYIGVNRLCTKD